MSGFVRAVGTAVAVVGSIALAAGTFGVGGIAAAGLLSSIGTYASAGAALLSVGAALTAKKPSNERQGQQLQFKIDPNGPVPYVMGRTAVGGTVVYRDTYGKDNSYQTFFTVLSGGGPVDAIEAFTADRAVIPFAGTNATGYYAKWLWQDQQLGQTPEPDALTNGITVAPYGYAGTPPGWGPGSKLSGYAAASLSLLFDTKARRYANGEPTPGWIVRGARVYDPRRDSTFPGGSGPCRWADPSDTAAHAAARATWVYSDRPALHGLMWRLGIWQRDETDSDARYQKIMGIGAPIDMIDLDAIAHAANVQDANGWAVGGQVDSQMDKWEVLKLIEQTGGCEAIANGALMSTLVKAPRVPLRTITAADLADGKLSAPGMRARSDRINGYRAKFRSEPHGWEMTPIDIVQVPDYVAADGRAKTGSGDFSLCPDPDQCAELAAYEVFDSRELSPIVLPLKPFAMGYRLGDCLTIDIPELGLSKVDAIVRAANRDPGTAICTLTFQTETAAKHPAALGLTGDTPPTPTLTAAPDVINPPAGGAWALVATVSVSSGLTVPALAIIGQVDNSNADAILFEYRKVSTIDWINGGLSAPDTVRREFTAVEADTPYEARVSYRGRGIYSEPLLLAAVDSSAAYADWAAGVQGPGKPEDNATVGATIGGDLKDALGNVVTGPQILNSALSLAPDGTLSVDLGNGPVPLGKVKLADIGGATETDRRRLTADLERIAAAVATLGAGQQTVMNVFRDAGMYADPASGQIKLFAIEQRAEQIAKLSVSLDAALGQIGLKASVDYVDRAITQAQLPGQNAALDSIYVRLTSAEANIDGLRASVQLKADATVVTGLSGTVTAVQQSLDALTATVATKASQTQVDQQGVRLSFAEQTLSALDGASITQAVSASRRIPADSDKAGEASILDMLNGARNLDTYQVGIALARTELGARVADANTAIASLATQLAVQIGNVTAQYASEVAARISGDQATVSDLATFKAQTGANVASINQALVAQSDAASSNARAITSVSSRVADTETSVSFLLSAANGNEAVAQLAVTAGGVVTGFRVNGQTRAFIIQANAFAIEGRQVFTYNSDTGVLMAPELVVQRLTVGSVGFDQLQLGSAGQTLSYELQNDVTIAKGGSTEVMWINITKLDADSEIEVQWSADVSSQDDVQFFAMFQVDGQTAKTRPLNEKYAKSNARTSTCPIVRLKGVAAGPRRIGITFSNQETDNASMTVYAGTLLKVTEIRKALLGMATGGEASGSSGSAGTGSGSGGGGTYNGGVAKFQTEQ